MILIIVAQRIQSIFIFTSVNLRISLTSGLSSIFPAVGTVNLFADGVAGGGFRAGKGDGGILAGSMLLRSAERPLPEALRMLQRRLRPPQLFPEAFGAPSFPAM